MSAFGTSERAYADLMLGGLLNAACDWRRENPPSERDINRVLAAVTGIGAKDEIEGMLATQMVATHTAIITTLHRQKQSETLLEGVSLSTGHGSRETESAEGRRLFLVTYRPSIRSSRAAGAKAVSGIAGSGENCVARRFGHAANPVEVDADEFTLPFHHLAGDEHVLDVAGVH